MIRIVAATEVGGAHRLESLALRVFGTGDRPEGWWARKLATARVDDALSRVAIADHGDPRSPRSWRGYVLVGMPQDSAPFVRTAGVGVVADARGQRVATRLLDAVVAAALAAGHRGVDVLAEPRLGRWYAARGFAAVREHWTLRTHGRGDAAPELGAIATDPPHDPDATMIVTGTAAVWSTAVDRRVLDDPYAGHVWLSRVGPRTRAWIVHGWIRRPHVAAAVAASGLRDRIPAGDALLVPLAPAVSWITANLVPHPLRVAERAWLVRRTTPAPTGH